MAYLKSADTIASGAGRAYAKVNNNNEELFFAKKAEANVEKVKGEVKTLGNRMVGHKAGLLTGTGTMTIYFITALFRRMLEEYKNTGVDVYFDMVIENDDPGSAAGKQVVLLRGVNLDSVPLALLDADSDDPIEEELSFTFEDFEILTEFNKI